MDIFLGYEHGDHDHAQRMAGALESRGWNVFWDVEIPAGSTWREFIGRNLEDARCIVVLWSHRSIESEHVIEEAEVGKDEGKLVPVLIERVRPPYGFRGIQAANLVGWDGDENDPQFTRLVRDVTGKIAAPPSSPPEPEFRAGGATRETATEPTLRGLSRDDSVADGGRRVPGVGTRVPAAAFWVAGVAVVVLVVGLSLISRFGKPGAPSPGTTFRDLLPNGATGPEMVVVPPGTFSMGSTSGAKNEQPTREVRFRESFAIGRYEVTFEEYDQCVSAGACREASDEGWGRGRRPVINVSWNDAVAYAQWLSTATGEGYRLPTESEWEYVARAGSKAKYWWGDETRRNGEDMANCRGCGSEWDGKQTSPVGSFTANDFGFYDTAGNVWEWVQDCWHDNYTGAPDDGSAWEAGEGGDCARRVLRGGAWGYELASMRSANRFGRDAGIRISIVGFRVAKDI